MENNLDQNIESTIKRVGMVIKIRPEFIEQYLALHADSNPGVRDLLTKYHLKNFSIFLQKIGNEYFEFGYYEYIGFSFDDDMAGLAAEQRNIEWLRICDPMQMPIDGEEGWTIMKQVYYNK